MTPAEYKRLVDNYNRQVKQHNDQVRRNIETYNREVKRHNDQVKRDYEKQKRDAENRQRQLNTQINNYNREVRRFNDAQRTQRQSLNNAINAYNSNRSYLQVRTTYITRESVENLENRYQELEADNQTIELNERSSVLYSDYPTQETSNSIQLINSITGIDDGVYIDPNELQRTTIDNSLYSISTELGRRWQGAIYSLNPSNPDAARHFCTSVREIFIQLLDIKAPDSSVLQHFPSCQLHDNKPNRREKIKYLLWKKNMHTTSMQNFVDSDINDLLTFFRTLNDGTHGSAGTFGIQQLLKIKKRAEDAIIFITALSNN
jgi:hypothetical protein